MEENKNEINLNKFSHNIIAINYKNRRKMKLPLVVWGVYDHDGNLLVAGPYSKVVDWFSNHRVIPVNHKGQKTIDTKIKTKFIKRSLFIRAIDLTKKGAFKSPIDLNEPAFDIKAPKI